MATVRKSTPRKASPAAAPKREPAAAVADAAVQPDVPVKCAFPKEMRGKECPVAVFNAPTSPNEKIAHSARKGAKPFAFLRGVLAAFSDMDADLVRRANPGNATYIEADPRLGEDPLVCSSCYPKTRWYSQRAYERHMAFAHID